MNQISSAGLQIMRRRSQSILFGDKSDWNSAIGSRLDGALYSAEFGKLSDTDVSRFDCIVSLTLADYHDLDTHQDFAGIKFLAPSDDLIKLCNDKLSLNRFLLQTEHRDLIPRLYEPGQAPFPYIIKRREDQWGMNSYLIRNAKDEQEHANLLGYPDFFLQAYISGTEEYATHILAVEGRIIFGTTIVSETASDFYVTGAQSSPNSFWLSREPRWIDALAGVISSIGYTGTCCIDHKVTNGAPRVFEINPRFGWSLHMDINNYLRAYLGALRSPAAANPFHAERCVAQPSVD